MSNRTMVEINHDCTPQSDKELLEWAKSFQQYLGSGQPNTLPEGVTWFNMRHHSEECPLGEPPFGWNS